MNSHIVDLVKFDIRHDMFSKATRFVDYELVEGDILEFGVYTGRSLVLLSHFHEEFKRTVHGHMTPNRSVIGLDSFKGLMKNTHERWAEGAFRTNHSWHPTIPKGEIVTPEKVTTFFKACELPAPVIIDGYYKDVRSEFDEKCRKVALIHIDCDLFDSTTEALLMVEEKIQDGAVILFDDWFNYKAAPDQGEQKAFNEFLKRNAEFSAIQYHPYATFGNSFILKRTS